jgi:LysM repeat protein
MPDRSLARYLAPLALVVVLTAAVVVVSSGGEDGSSSDKTATAPSDRAKPGTKTKKFYRVKAGDLLSEISEKTGVDINTIIKLNPDVDPQALQAGQLIRLRQ